MFKNIHSIIFDLDDTLHNQRLYIFTKFKYISAILAIQLNFNEEQLYFSMCKLYDECWWRAKVFNILFKEIGVENTPGLIERCINLYHECPHGTESLFPDTTRTLEFLKKKYQLGLLTDGNTIEQKNKIKNLELEKFFDQILLLEGKNEKPSIYGFEEIANRFKLPQREILYIGDNPYRDVYGTLQTEMQTCWLKGYSYWNNRPLPFKAEKKITEINYLSDLMKLI